MALVKPVNINTVAFDATTAHTFYFTSSGGTQVVANRLTIRNNTTNAIVYQNKLTTYSFSQTVPANTLTNGVYYNFYFNTYDISDNISDDSLSSTFRCYTAPTIIYNNITEGGVITSSNYTISLTYSQSQGELLDYLIVYLYDSNGNKLAESSKLTSTSIPPITFTYDIYGLNDTSIYSLKAVGVSINGTETIKTVGFRVSYYFPVLYTTLYVENKCDDGYVYIYNNLSFADGKVEPDSKSYYGSAIVNSNALDSYMQWDTWYTPTNNIVSLWGTWDYVVLDRINYAKYMFWDVVYSIPDSEIIGVWEDSFINRTVVFDEGFSIPPDFQFQVWMTPSVEGDIVEFYPEDGLEANKIGIALKSGIPSGQSTIKNWFELYSSNGNLLQASNYVDFMSRNSYFSIWIKKVGNVYTTILQVIRNGSGNDITWTGTDVYPTIMFNGDVTNCFPVKEIKLLNGTIDQIDATSETSRVYSISFPSWTYYTKINCDFKTLNGGNTDLLLSQISSIRFKRRLYGDYNWITLAQINVENIEDLNTVSSDYLVPTGDTFEYAIVPVLADGSEGTYVIESVDTQFNWCYLTDGDTTIKFISNVEYGNTENTPLGGVFSPIGRQYPITIYNSESRYQMGSFTGDVFTDDFWDTREFNRIEATKYSQSVLDFINNKKSKILKDWNGRIRLVDTNVNSATSETVDLKSGRITVSFNWVEKGSYNNQSDLYDNGLIDINV